MQMKKTLGILLAVCFLMSVTAAAVGAKADNNGPDNHAPIAKDDHFNFDSHNIKGNVLFNDKGTGLKVVRVSKTSNDGKINMKSNGDFSYKPPSDSKHKDSIKDSFTYMIKGKNGKTSTAKVTITYKFSKRPNKQHGYDYI